MWWAWRRLKTNREEYFTKRVRFVYEYIAEYIQKAKKIEKVVMRKVATSKKSITHNRQWKTKHISVCESLIVIFKVLYSS